MSNKLLTTSSSRGARWHKLGPGALTWRLSGPADHRLLWAMARADQIYELKQQHHLTFMAIPAPDNDSCSGRTVLLVVRVEDVRVHSNTRILSPNWLAQKATSRIRWVELFENGLIIVEELLENIVVFFP